jgi:hypothetical protein
VARYVYLALSRGRHKIGVSKHPDVRVPDATRDKEAVCLHTFLSARPFKVEFALHRRFAAKNIKSLGREWFTLSDEDIALVCAIHKADSAEELPPALYPGPLPGRVSPSISLRLPPAVYAALEALAVSDHRKTCQMAALLLEDAVVSRGLCKDRREAS